MTANDRDLFPTLSRLLPGRPTTAPESAGVLRLIAACGEAGVPAGPLVASWSRSLPGRVRRRVARFGAALVPGEPLLAVARQVPGVVHPDHATAIRFGERTGLVTQALRTAADATDRIDTVAVGRARAAIGYVAVVSLMFLLVMTFLAFKLMPQFVKIFDDFGTDLPPVSRLAIAISRWCAVILPLVLIAVPLVIAFRWLRSLLRRGRHGRGSGSELRRAGWLDMLAMGVRSGLPADVAVAQLLESIEPRSRDSTALARAAAAGGTVGTQLATAGIVQDADAPLVDAGLAAGEGDLVLGWLADERRRTQVRRLATWGEAIVPLAAVLFGGIVLVESLGVYAVLTHLVEALS